jgi:hypothetical protein
VRAHIGRQLARGGASALASKAKADAMVIPCNPRLFCKQLAPAQVVILDNHFNDDANRKSESPRPLEIQAAARAADAFQLPALGKKPNRLSPLLSGEVQQILGAYKSGKQEVERSQSYLSNSVGSLKWRDLFIPARN